LVKALTRGGHVVSAVGTAVDGLREVVQQRPDVVVLDLGLPDLDGGAALRMMRGDSDVPIIVATARTGEANIIRLLNPGADDYVTKPYSGDHLLARIAAVLRRRGGGPHAPAALEVGPLRLDLARRTATLDGRPLDLTDGQNPPAGARPNPPGNGPRNPAGGPKPDRPAGPVFAPAIYLPAVDRPPLKALAAGSGATLLTLTGILPTTGGGCDLAWGGTADLGAYATEITDALRARTGLVMSIGTAGGADLAQTCGSAAALEARLKEVTDLGPRSLDFVLDSRQATDLAANLRRAQAIKALKAELPDLKVSYTLCTVAGGTLDWVAAPLSVGVY
jgi:CheY-like chemotaxis protein